LLPSLAASGVNVGVGEERAEILLQTQVDGGLEGKRHDTGNKFLRNATGEGADTRSAGDGLAGNTWTSGRFGLRVDWRRGAKDKFSDEERENGSEYWRQGTSTL
jgi:hypothetical protein